MTARWKGLSLPVIFAVLALIPVSLQAGNFVFVNTNIVGPNSVTSFSVTPGSGSLVNQGTFVTGGSGSCGYFADPTIVTSPNGKYVFAADCGTSDVAVFQVNQTTGALSLVGRFTAGVEGYLDMSLAISPFGNLLFDANGYGEGEGSITTFAVGNNGTLTTLGYTELPSFPIGIAVQPGGNFLAIALVGQNSIAMYNIGLGGALSAVPGSPFAAPVAGEAPGTAGVDFNCGFPSLLFTGIANINETVVDTFDVAANGGLGATPSSPFQFFNGTGANSNVVLFDFRDHLLFASNQFSNTVDAFKVDMMGNLTPGPNSPFGLAGEVTYPSGMASNVAPILSGGLMKPTTMLYVADNGSTAVSVLTVASDGTLKEVLGSPFYTGAEGANEVSLATDPSLPCGLGTAPLF